MIAGGFAVMTVLWLVLSYTSLDLEPDLDEPQAQAARLDTSPAAS